MSINANICLIQKPAMCCSQQSPYLQNAVSFDIGLLFRHVNPSRLSFMPWKSVQVGLTHWGRVTHICVNKLTILDSDNGLSPDRRQAIIWTNAGLLLIGPLGTNFSEILIEILRFSFKKMRVKVSSAKRRPFCLGLNVLSCNLVMHIPVSGLTHHGPR